MKHTLAALTLLITPAAALDEHRWRDRPVLLFADGAADVRLVEQRARFDARRAGVLDRDIVVLEIPGGSPLRARFDLPEDAFAVILIGKDGGEKFRARRPVDPWEIFSLIDTMPMRRREMRED